MYSYEELKEIINDISTDKQASKRKEVKELPHILRENEQIKNAATGLIESSYCLLVVTDQRVILVDKGILYGLKVHEIGYDKLSSLEYETGLVFGELRFTTSGSVMVVKKIVKQYITPIYESIHSAWDEFKQKQVAPTPSVDSSPTPSAALDSEDLISQLERLANLKKANMLTDEEFQAAKAKLLK